MLAGAFSSVQYPILPVAERYEDGKIKLFKRNTRLFTPRDFDYSPYFDIIKYPYFSFSEIAAYRSLPWNTQNIICNERGDYLLPAEQFDDLIEDK